MERNQPCAAAEIEQVHIPCQFYLTHDGTGQISGQFNPARFIVPGNGNFVEIPLFIIHRLTHSICIYFSLFHSRPGCFSRFSLPANQPSDASGKESKRGT
jgi:hypothetical protein